jgi:hypothetical protein
VPMNDFLQPKNYFGSNYYKIASKLKFGAIFLIDVELI